MIDKEKTGLKIFDFSNDIQFRFVIKHLLAFIVLATFYECLHQLNPIGITIKRIVEAILVIGLVLLAKKNNYRRPYMALIKGLILVLDLLVCNSLCFSCSMIIYNSFFYEKFHLQYEYLAIENTLVFVFYLGFLIYLKKIYKVNKNAYPYYFLVYCISVVFGFIPTKYTLALFRMLFIRSDKKYIVNFSNYVFPAIKEAILAFIILDSSDLFIKKYKKDK